MNITIIDPGYVYEVPNLHGDGAQRLTFYKEVINEDGQRELAHDGLLHEAVVTILIDRLTMYVDNAKVQNPFLESALRHLKEVQGDFQDEINHNNQTQ